MLTVAVAFVVFGIIDNGIMIMAGTAIDNMVGAALGISTMASAGIGNTISDAIGIASGRLIEYQLHKVIPAVQHGELTKRQVTIAETFGIIAGCLIGMIPLLFL